MNTTNIEYGYYQSPVGVLKLVIENDYLIELSSGHQYFKLKTSLLMDSIINQLEEYFNNQRQVFNIKYKIISTPFTKAVLEETYLIPYGVTCSYLELSQKAFNSNKARAVGQALNRNPIMIIIPCHRVIGHNHQLVGYNGGLEIKSFLLNLERQ